MEMQTTTIGFICPVCGREVMRDVSIFSLSGGLEVSCFCGESVKVSVTSDRKLKLSAPCLACPEPHSVKLSSVSFFQRDLFTLQCPFTALDICFTGRREKVKEAIKKHKKYLEENIYKQLERTANEPEENHILEPEQMGYENPFVMSEILALLREMLSEGRVECECGGGGVGKLHLDITSDSVILTCTVCGRQCRLRAVTESDTIYLSELDKIILR